jgi:predicted transcriptional regulator
MSNKLTNIEIQENLDKCVQNIVQNFGIPGVRFSEFFSKRGYPTLFTMFVDSTDSIALDKTEIINNIGTNKDYRRVHNIIKIKLINAALAHKHLADELLKRLGYKEFI